MHGTKASHWRSRSPIGQFPVSYCTQWFLLVLVLMDRCNPGLLPVNSLRRSCRSPQSGRSCRAPQTRPPWRSRRTLSARIRARASGRAHPGGASTRLTDRQLEPCNVDLLVVPGSGYPPIWKMLDMWTCSRSLSSALLPFFGGRVPLNRLQKKVGTFILTSLLEDLGVGCGFTIQVGRCWTCLGCLPEVITNYFPSELGK